MKSQHLILGATGGIGYGLVKALLSRGIRTTILVRDMEKAFDLFGNHPHLEFVQGDVMDSDALSRVAHGKKFIFHGVNTSYERWETFMPAATGNVIEAAQAAGATVIFPGNIYNYGLIREPATEITPFKPAESLGRLRVAIEEQLQTASDLGRIQTLIVRLPEIWGPNVTNEAFAPVFEHSIRRKPIPWLFTTDVPQQMVWNMDAGRAIAALMDRDATTPFEVYHYAGRSIETMKSFFDRLGGQTGQPVRQRVIGRAGIRMLGLVKPVLRKVSKLEYKYTNTILLDDSKFRRAVPDFQETPVDSAVRETLAWFETERVQPRQAARKRKRAGMAVDFVSDNTAIVVFPLLIALIGGILPFVGKNAVLFGVVAGIYWAPLFRLASRKVSARMLPQAAALPLLLMATPNVTAQDVRPEKWNETQVHVSVGMSAPVLHGGTELMSARGLRQEGRSYFEPDGTERRSVGRYGPLVGWGFEIGFHRPSGLLDRLMLGATATVSLTGSTPQAGGYSEGYFFNTVKMGVAWKYYPAQSGRIAIQGDLGLSSVFTKNRFLDQSGAQAFHHQFGIGVGASFGLALEVFGPWSVDVTQALMTARVEVSGHGNDVWRFGTTNLMVRYRF